MAAARPMELCFAARAGTPAGRAPARLKKRRAGAGATVRCAATAPAPMGEKTEYRDGPLERAFMGLFARKMEKYAAAGGGGKRKQQPAAPETEKEKAVWEWDYASFVDVSRRVMVGRTRAQQQEAVREVLLSMLPPGAPEQFRKLFPPTRWACEFNAALTVPFFHWLVGPSEVIEVEVNGVKQKSGVLIKKSKLLIAAAWCSHHRASRLGHGTGGLGRLSPPDLARAGAGAAVARRAAAREACAWRESSDRSCRAESLPSLSYPPPSSLQPLRLPPSPLSTSAPPAPRRRLLLPRDPDPVQGAARRGRRRDLRRPGSPGAARRRRTTPRRGHLYNPDDRAPLRAMLALKRHPRVEANVSRIEEVEEPLDPALACANDPAGLSGVDSPIVRLVTGEDGVGEDAAPFICIGGFRQTRAVYELEDGGLVL